MGRKKMEAKFAGKCGKCGIRFEAGAMILWAKGEGANHAECPAAARKAGPSAEGIEECHRIARKYAMQWGPEAYDPECEEVAFERAYYEKFGEVAA